ncbi:MAG: alkyl sulfatase dimerization domain-containing protein [Acidimicrobiales bacterium]
MGDLHPKPAHPSTTARNATFAERLPLAEQADVERASRGLVAQHPTGVVEGPLFPAWDVHRYDFIRDQDEAPDTVNPSLWRQAKINCIHGLFQVAERVWQVRGYDISNITFIQGDTGWIVIDPLISVETAAMALELADEHLGARPVVAVIYTHSHADHFGGVLGVTTQDDVDAGRCRIIAPAGFLHEAVSENVIAGPAMLRRALYMFGPLLPPGPRGQVDAGLGKTTAMGTVSLVAPTEDITHTGQELVIDGVRVVFQMTPEAEAPAEMNFHFPDLRLLCMAENCTHTMHNLLTPRGALVRDALAWSKYIHEAIELFADETDTCFASHHWPRFGADDVRTYLTQQRDLYRWLHDQTMRLANKGLTMVEIAEELDLAPELEQQFHVRGYYGTVNHNVKAIYQRYLGWFDGNPANLHPHTPERTGTKLVEYMGGPDAVLERARADFDAGDFRWVAQVVNHVVFAHPDREDARLLQADALEQLGYQAESAVWRNFYLCAASELRHGHASLGQAPLGGLAPSMTTEMLFDAIAVRLVPDRLAGLSGAINWTIADRGERHVAGISNRTLFHTAGRHADDALATVTCPSADLIRLADGQLDPDSLVVDGDRTVVDALVAAVDTFDRIFPIVTP